MNSVNRTAASATMHCLTGCAIGEILGMIIAAAFALSNGASVGLSIVLAFVFGYSFSMFPLLRHGLSWRRALRLALIADTVSIATMELADNGFILLVPNAIDATLADALFWTSLAASLVVAFLAAFPVNRFLIARGQGHAKLHQHHH